MPKQTKTNAVRLLEHAGIDFKTHEYHFDENDLAATHVAEELGEDISRVFKTLVLRGERKGLFVCVVPGDKEVDLKKAAQAAGDKKADLIAMKELLPLTGSIRGGCSPIGINKPFPTFFHSSALGFDTIYVSAGMRGLQVELSPQALIEFVGGSTADLIKE